MNGIATERSTARRLQVSQVNSGELSWGSSLVLKIVFLGIAVLFVYWVGWPQPSIPPVSVPAAPPMNFLSSNPISTNYPGSAGLPPEAVPFAPHRGEGKVTRIHAVRDDDKGPTGTEQAFIVDLNDGTLAELKHLPGIGAVLAERIVAHRASHGAFRRVEDLVLVPGIGKKRFQQLRPFVAVRKPTSGIGIGS
jgi:competence protein ComEA